MYICKLIDIASRSFPEEVNDNPQKKKERGKGKVLKRKMYN
jgi:hypothetical protein